ncbi:MAG TPA: hypothetical protein VFN67_35900 [Polyangiales bacterium]|nr:hypothetical protein [Polyangiales bacterium]
MKALVCVVGALCLVACGSDEGSTSMPPKPPLNKVDPLLRVLAPDASYDGRSLRDWAVEYMDWYYSWTSDMCETAENDPDGSNCGFNQPAGSSVFFFGTCDFSRKRDTVVMRDKCKVPYGKAIMVPVSFIGDDDASAEDEPRTPEEISDNVTMIADTMRELRLVGDDQAVDDLSGYKVGPISFSFDVPAAPNWQSCNGYDGVENTTIDPSFVAGYFALYAPPSIGEHHLEYSGVYTYFERDYFRNVDARFEVTEQ